MTHTIPSMSDIKRAHTRIARHILQTPVLTSHSIDEMVDASVFFKCENFQKVGAFKMRGAANAIFSIKPEDRSRGFTTHSSGNHAQAVALASKMAGVKAYIVMPSNSAEVKKNAVIGYGAEVVFCEPTLKSREDTLKKLQKETGATFIPPYDHPDIIAGQATAAKELMEEVVDLHVIMAPVGGGGLLSGTALACHYLSPKTEVIGTEPELADDAYQSLKKGKVMPAKPPVTIADGLRTSLSELTYTIIKDHVKEIVTVTEDEIVNAMRIIWERMKIIIEPSCAVPFAALLKRKEDFKGKKIGIILSGGNVDLEDLPFGKSFS